MHYYQHNIGDYRKDTSHLSTLEHGIYRQLLDWYYLDEQPIPKETQVVMRRLRLGSDSDKTSLENVLADFFILKDDGYHQARCDVEIAEYQKNADKNRANGKKGGRPKANKHKAENPVGFFGLGNENPNQTQPKGNHKPLTNNHKPNIKAESAKAPKAQRLKLDSIPEDWFNFCRSERPDLNPKDIWDQFKDYWSSIGGAKGTKLDWFATWRNWVRNQRVVQKTAHDRKMQTLAGLTGGIHGTSADAEFKPITELQTIDMEQSNANLLR